MINGGDGNDVIFGMNANDTLNGGTGNDKLMGGSGNDTLRGGAGADYLEGGSGNDTYAFNLGDGQDEIYDSSGIDTLSFGAGINPADVSVSRVWGHNHLELKINGTADKVVLKNQYTPLNSKPIENISFSDGTVWTWDDVRLRLLSEASTAGDDLIHGFDTNDTIDGGAGDDRLEGGKLFDFLSVGKATFFVYSAFKPVEEASL